MRDTKVSKTLTIAPQFMVLAMCAQLLDTLYDPKPTLKALCVRFGMVQL